MIDLAVFLFGGLVTGCVSVFIYITRSEFQKMSEHPERYQKPLKDVAMDNYEEARQAVSENLP